MNIEELKIEMLKHKISAPELAIKIGMSKKTIYSRLNGTTPFRQNEILAISKELDLSRDRIFEIFFAQEVA